MPEKIVSASKLYDAFSSLDESVDTIVHKFFSSIQYSTRKSEEPKNAHEAALFTALQKLFEDPSFISSKDLSYQFERLSKTLTPLFQPADHSTRIGFNMDTMPILTYLAEERFLNPDLVIKIDKWIDVTFFPQFHPYPRSEPTYEQEGWKIIVNGGTEPPDRIVKDYEVQHFYSTAFTILSRTHPLLAIQVFEKLDLGPQLRRLDKAAKLYKKYKGDKEKELLIQRIKQKVRNFSYSDLMHPTDVRFLKNATPEALENYEIHDHAYKSANAEWL